MAEEDPSTGTFAAIAVNVVNPKEPRFYIGSNVADGEVLEARLEGKRDTMVDAFYYSSSSQVRIKNHYAKTAPFNGLVQGEYVMSVIKNGAPIAQKTVFLGGTRDADYESRLKTYQAKVRAQGEVELSEIRQVTGLLEKQLSESQIRFRQGRGWEKIPSTMDRAPKSNRNFI